MEDKYANLYCEMGLKLNIDIIALSQKNWKIKSGANIWLQIKPFAHNFNISHLYILSWRDVELYQDNWKN